MQRAASRISRPVLQRAATSSRLVSVRAMAAKAHNPGAITKKVFFDMEIGGNKAGGCCSVGYMQSHTAHQPV